MQQTGGAVNDSMTERIDKILGDPDKSTGLYGAYRSENPSEVLRQAGSYYDPDENWGGVM